MTGQDKGFKVHNVVFFNRDYNVLYAHPQEAEQILQHYVKIKKYADNLSESIKVNGSLTRMSMGNFDLVLVPSVYTSAIYLLEKNSGDKYAKKKKEIFEHHLRVLIEDNIERPHIMTFVKGDCRPEIDCEQIKTRLISLLESRLLQ